MSRRFQTIMRKIAETDAVLGVHLEEDGRVFFDVQTEDERSQVLWAKLSVTEDGEEIVHMMSEIGPAEPRFFEEMLKRNLQLRYSRVAIVESQGEARFAIVYSYPFAELETVELAKAFEIRIGG